jgi:ATP-dependent RNA helicase DDX56/DBP9
MNRSLLSENPDIVVSTPSRTLLHINLSDQTLSTKILHLVIDEADLVLSYGYEDDLDRISKALPKGLQTFLMSATLTEEVETLKTLFCRNPAILRLEEGEKEKEGEGVTQYIVKSVLLSFQSRMTLLVADLNLRLDVLKTKSSCLFM